MPRTSDFLIPMDANSEAEAERLFPGTLAACFDAFVEAVEAEGGADIKFTKTQVSYRLERQFTWLVPLTKKKSLLLLDLYEESPDPRVRTIITYRPTKHTHQFEVTEPGLTRDLAAEGWFARAYEWGLKERE